MSEREGEGKEDGHGVRYGAGDGFGEGFRGAGPAKD